MVNIILCGAAGAMGQKVIAAAEKSKRIRIIAQVDRKYETSSQNTNINSIEDFDKIIYPEPKPMVDAILDFSHPSAVEGVINYAQSKKIPLVIATTGYTPEQEKFIAEKAKTVSIMKSSNYSEKVFIMLQACKFLASHVKGDIEIIETHHNLKKDAPSGTAKTLANAMLEAQGYGKIVYGRTLESGKREQGDIGISAIRGGTVAGIHEVQFLTDTGVISIKEEEYGKEGFAEGALKACEFMVDKPAGKLYGMNDLLGQ